MGKMKPLMNLKQRRNEFLRSQYYIDNYVNTISDITFLPPNSVPTIYDESFMYTKSSEATATRDNILCVDAKQTSIDSRIQEDNPIHDALVHGASETSNTSEISQTRLQTSNYLEAHQIHNTESHFSHEDRTNHESETHKKWIDKNQTQYNTEDTTTFVNKSHTYNEVELGLYHEVDHPPHVPSLMQAHINHDHPYEKSCQAIIAEEKRLRNSLNEAQGRIRVLTQQVKRLKNTVATLKNKVRDLKRSNKARHSQI